MARFTKSWTPRKAIWSLLVVSVVGAVGPRTASAQYSWNNPGTQTGNWNVANRWTGGPAGTFPNAADTTATFNLPLSNAPSGNFNVQISNTAGASVTVGGITVNNYSDGGVNDINNLRFGANGNGTITFQSNSGNAFFTENAASPTDSTGATKFYAPVIFGSNTVITQNHALSANGATAFSSTANSAGGITAAPGITLTKEGLGNVQFEVAPTAPGTGFQGALVVNAGGVRQEANVFANASAITVNPGGQFQLGSSTVTDWGLAPGGVLTIGGAGKATGTVNSEGALRFQNNAATANFNNAVSLASDATVFVSGNLAPTPPNPVTRGHLILTQTVSGNGGLTKGGDGILELTQGNEYAGITTVNGGVLLVNNTTGSATGTGAVTVNAAATLAGSGTVAGPVSFVGGVLSPGNSPGLITLGATSFDAASILDYQLALPDVIDSSISDLTNVNGNLVLDGTLNITGLAGFGAGIYRLFNFTGLLTDNGLNVGLVPDGFSGQVVQGDNAVLLIVSPVPEPATWILAASGLALTLATRQSRRKRASE